MTDDQADKLSLYFDEVFGWFIFLGSIWLISGPVIGLWHCYVWLKTAHWPTLRVIDLVGGRPSITWLGLQQIIDWFLDLSLAWFLFVSGFLVFSVGLSWMERVGERVRSLRNARELAKVRADREALLKRRASEASGDS